MQTTLVAHRRSLQQAPTTFPFCNCMSKLRRSPYRLSFNGAIMNYKGWDWICYKVYVDPTDTICEVPGNKEACCDASLYKIEFNVGTCGR